MCESLLYSTVFKTIMLLGAFMLSELDSGYIKLPTSFKGNYISAWKDVCSFLVNLTAFMKDCSVISEG